MKRKLRKITVTMRPEDVVQVTSNDGGYMAGVCGVCGARGWLNGQFGLRSDSPDAKEWRGTHLVHKPSCPMNEFAERKRC